MPAPPATPPPAAEPERPEVPFMEPSAPPPAAATQADPGDAAIPPERKEHWFNHPGVKRVLETFNGDIKDVIITPKN